MTSAIGCADMDGETQTETTEQGVQVALSGSASGSGEIIGEHYIGNGSVGIFTLVEEHTWTGDIAGTRAQAEPEEVFFQFATGAGTYSAIFDFEGTVNGVACTGVMVEHGTANLYVGNWEGQWHFLTNDCGFNQISGSFDAFGVFDSPTTYDFTATYEATATTSN